MRSNVSLEKIFTAVMAITTDTLQSKSIQTWGVTGHLRCSFVSLHINTCYCMLLHTLGFQVTSSLISSQMETYAADGMRTRHPRACADWAQPRRWGAAPRRPPAVPGAPRDGRAGAPARIGSRDCGSEPSTLNMPIP